MPNDGLASKKTPLPCPFCGQPPRVTKRQDECLWSHNTVDWHGVHCSTCDVGFDWPEGAERSALEQWNSRASLACHAVPA
jgi:Lar family restriction alleviation protein